MFLMCKGGTIPAQLHRKGVYPRDNHSLEIKICAAFQWLRGLEGT